MTSLEVIQGMHGLSLSEVLEYIDQLPKEPREPALAFLLQDQITDRFLQYVHRYMCVQRAYEEPEKPDKLIRICHMGWFTGLQFTGKLRHEKAYLVLATTVQHQGHGAYKVLKRVTIPFSQISSIQSSESPLQVARLH